MSIIFASTAWNDYLYWQKTDKQILKRINLLIKNIQRNPFNGIGKPEALRHSFTGYWSRRINDEHRLVYKVNEDQIFIAQIRYHYSRHQ
ncbi:MAG: Txe/YoeB family addiction module toxin [Mariprofundales bacterium]